MKKYLFILFIPLAMAAKCSSFGSASSFVEASRTTKKCKGDAGYKSELDEIITEFKRDFGEEVTIREAPGEECVRGKVSHSIVKKSSFSHAEDSREK